MHLMSATSAAESSKVRLLMIWLLLAAAPAFHSPARQPGDVRSRYVDTLSSARSAAPESHEHLTACADPI